jgi:hypothetical protein
MVFALFTFTCFISACGTLDIASYDDVVLIDKRVKALSQEITNLKGNISCWGEIVPEKNTRHDPKTGEVIGFKCRE